MDGQTDGQTDRRTEATKYIISLYYFCCQFFRELLEGDNVPEDEQKIVITVDTGNPPLSPPPLPPPPPPITSDF